MSPPGTFARNVSDDVLDRFYSTPILSGTLAFPGQTHESALATLEVLRDDFKTYHVFVNNIGFHNHASHHVLALYALGASPELIKEAYYGLHVPNLLPSLVSPERITEENFTEHLGDERYYDGYLAFFTEYLQKNSPTGALERFIFSPAYNFTPGLETGGDDLKKHPRMLDRLLAGLLHPFIHVAYGLEFGILGQVAEGLAQTAVHSAAQIEIIPPSYFNKSPTDNISGFLSTFTSTLSLDVDHNHVPPPEKKRPMFAFHRRIRDDPEFKLRDLPNQPGQRYLTVVKQSGGAIHSLVREWTEEWLVGTRSEAEAEIRLKSMVEEVIWGNVIWCSVGGWASRGDSARVTNADFFLAHLVTSAIFLPKLIIKEEALSPSPPPFGRAGALLSFGNRLLLLQTYLAACAGWQISRGNNPLPITDFYAATDEQLQLSGSPRARSQVRAGSARSVSSLGPSSNPWTYIIPSAIQAREEHTPKMMRSLANFAVRWGMCAPGYFGSDNENGNDDDDGRRSLEGIERLDGTLFVRVAGLTLDRLGWVHEGEEFGRWDRDGSPN